MLGTTLQLSFRRYGLGEKRFLSWMSERFAKWRAWRAKPRTWSFARSWTATFLRNHALWYHHRRGAWGTEEGEYTFLLGFSTKGAFVDRPPASPWRILRALLWAAIFAVAAMGIWGALMLVFR